VVTALSLVLGMNYILLWNGFPHGPFDVWLVPSDIWGTYLASVALVQGHLTSMYTATPGALILLAPVAAVGHAFHLEVGPNFGPYTTPTAWPLLGPLEILISALPLFAADALAERAGVAPRRRMFLALAEGAVLANVTIRWGHPEYAVALGLVLYAVAALEAGRLQRAGWLLGAAIAVQPFALLALPALAVRAGRAGRADSDDSLRVRPMWDVVWRAVLPYLVLLAPALAFSWHQSTQWLLHQANFPTFNHPTPFTPLATPIPHSLGGVSAGPGRLVGLAGALVVSAVVCWPHGRGTRALLWAVACSFVLWLAFESVIDDYYTWPVLAVALVLAAQRGRLRWWGTVVLALFITWFSDATWAGVWPWWSILMLSLAALLVVTFPTRTRIRAPDPVDPADPTDPVEPVGDGPADGGVTGDRTATRDPGASLETPT
jgi:hypothetical protein